VCVCGVCDAISRGALAGLLLITWVAKVGSFQYASGTTSVAHPDWVVHTGNNVRRVTRSVAGFKYGRIMQR